VTSLVRQIEGELVIKGERGARYEIVFKEL
jgi:hypothetical protein